MAHLAENAVTHTNPNRALEYMRNASLGIVPKPDLIFLDVNMPFMNGFEFLTELEAIDQDYYPYVVMLSSSVDDEDIARAREHWSVLRFLHKPLTIEALSGLEVHTLSPVPVSQARLCA